AALALERVQLVRHDQLDPAVARQRIEPRRGFGCRAKLGAAMNDEDAAGGFGERDRPIDRAVAAAGDDDALAAKRLAPRHHVEDALALVILDACERRAVGAKGADTGGDDDAPRLDDGTARGRKAETAALQRLETFDALIQMIMRGEGRRLPLELCDKRGRVDHRMAGNVVDRLLGIE